VSHGAFPSSAFAVAGILFLSASAGWILSPSFLPRGHGWALERCGWSIAIAVFLLSAHVVVAFAFGLRPGWTSFLALATFGFVGARRFGLPREDRPIRNKTRFSPVSGLLLTLTVVGILVYLVRSLAEPMWSNDFLAVWGLKGKTIFASAGIPQILFRWPEFEFSNPSYPIGLPLLYAGTSFLLGRWDDHALAVMFPLLQVGTLLVLIGWLERRGVVRSVALAGAALVANCGPLYSSWLTGMAEVPAAFTFLLLGTALCDVIDDTDPGALRRLGFASLLVAATKNEGLLLMATSGALLAWRMRRQPRLRIWAAGAAVLLPGLASVLLHRLVLGGHPIRGLDLGLLRAPGLAGRARETLREEFHQLVSPVWPAILAVLVLVLVGRRRIPLNPLLILVATSLLTYLALPVLCPFGPVWLVHWTVGRIAGALVPLLAGGVAMEWPSERDPDGKLESAARP
jgi:hypothetical protein